MGTISKFNGVVFGVVALTLAVTSCGDYPNWKAAQRQTPKSGTNQWEFIVNSGSRYHVTAFAYPESLWLENSFNDARSRNAKILEQLNKALADSKTEARRKEHEEFIADLEDYIPTPFSLGDWSMLVPARVYNANEDEAWLVFARFESRSADLALVVRTEADLSGHELTNALAIVTEYIANQSETNWNAIPMSDVPMSNARGQLDAPELRERTSNFAFPTQQ